MLPQVRTHFHLAAERRPPLPLPRAHPSSPCKSRVSLSCAPAILLRPSTPANTIPRYIPTTHLSHPLPLPSNSRCLAFTPFPAPSAPPCSPNQPMTAFSFSRSSFPRSRPARPRRSRLPSRVHSVVPKRVNSTPSTTPLFHTPHSLSSPTSPTTSSSSAHPLSPSPDESAQVAQLWREAQHILQTLPKTTQILAFETSLQPYLQANPENPYLWHALLTRLAEYHGFNHPTIRDVLPRALFHVKPGRRGVLLHFHATLHLYRGALPSALRILQDNLDTEGIFHAPLYLLLASVHLRLNDPSAARATYRAAVRTFPRHPGIWSAWARFEASQGAREDALAHCRQALDADPSNPRAWQMLLHLLRSFRAGPAHISDVLHEALGACPRDPGLRLHLARLEERRKGSRAALSVLNCLQNSSHPDVLRTIARLHFTLADIPRARQYFRAAVGPPPSFAATDLDLSSVSASASGSGSGSPSGSAFGSASTVATNPSTETRSTSQHTRYFDRRKNSRQHKSVKALHTWALMEAKVGNIDEARSLLSEARSLCQTDAGIWRAIAELEARERNYDDARKAFQNAIAINPRDPRIFLAWGRTEALAGNSSKSDELLSKADVLSTQHQRDGAKRSGRKVSGQAPISTLFDTDSPSGSEVESDRGDTDHDSDEENASMSRNISLTPHALAGALRERAMLASRDGRFDDSVQLLTRASQMEPGNEVGWRLLASEEGHRSGVEQLRNVYRTGLEHVAPPSKAKLLHWWGQDERTNGNISDARELFRKATLANPDYMSAWMSWGLLEKSDGRIDEACRIFERATERAEEDAVRAPYIFLTWGRVEEIDRRRPDVAAKIFERGVKLAPCSGTLLAAWALLECNRGNWEAARALFRKATQLDPKHGSAWHQWALMEARRCNFKSAIELFEAGHEHDKTNASLVASWAAVEGNDLQNTARGRDLFQRAMEIDSMYGAGWLAWGKMELSAENVNQARDLFERASKATGGGAASWHALGQLEWKHCGNADLAVKHFDRGVKSDGVAFAPLYAAFAALMVENGRPQKALEVLEDGIRKFVDEQGDGLVQLLNARARVELNTGAQEEALETVLKSIKVTRRQWETWELLSDIEKVRGNSDAAVSILRDGITACAGTRCGNLYRRMGELLVELGKPNDMRSVMREGILNSPCERELWTTYIELEQHMGFDEKAEHVRNRFVQVFSRSSDSEIDALSLE